MDFSFILLRFHNFIQLLQSISLSLICSCTSIFILHYFTIKPLVHRRMKEEESPTFVFSHLTFISLSHIYVASSIIVLLHVTSPKSHPMLPKVALHFPMSYQVGFIQESSIYIISLISHHSSQAVEERVDQSLLFSFILQVYLTASVSTGTTVLPLS